VAPKNKKCIRGELKILEDYFRDVPCVVPYAMNRQMLVRIFKLKKINEFF